MEELKCKNCGSRDLEYQNGIYVCKNCDSKYVADFIPHGEYKSAIIELQDEMVDALNMMKCDIAINKANRLLKMDAHNATAWATLAMAEIGNGIASSNAEAIVEGFEKAILYAKSDEIDDMRSLVNDHIRRFEYKLASYSNDLRLRVESLKSEAKDALPYYASCSDLDFIIAE